jgi:hypothetical protein
MQFLPLLESDASLHTCYPIKDKGGVGDHWCFILNFMSSSVIGTKFPNIVCCSARKLHCKSKHLVQAYNAELDMLYNRHKMYQRIYYEEFLYLMNNWDKELVQFKLHSEVK